MIRIDEIYDNVFLPRAIKHTNEGNQFNSNYRVGLHWFEPFGTTQFENIASKPPVNWWPGKPGYPSNNTRVIFWDQEPLHRYRFESFIESFLKPYRSVVSFIEDDRLMADDIHATVAFLQALDVDSEILFG